ncbi:MAG TPA: hypothetical protein VK658_15030 [Chryseolinea sp.]|nr:hypothetical protein [Chryseolinea sp.]
MKKVTPDLRPLKRWLQKGEIAELAAEVGISSRQATNIITGKSANWLYVEKFLVRVERNKALVERCTILGR